MINLTKKQIAEKAVEALKIEYPEAICSLVYTDPLQLLIATRLAAQCTDARVNMVTPALFERFKTVDDFASSTADEVAEYIKNKLTETNLVKDAVVTVEYANLTYSVLGEVKTPARYNINRDYITILDAISEAGDLTIQGQRTNIKVLRNNEKGEQQCYIVNLCSLEDLYNSPAYYLQQNDIIYVEPNKMRARQSTVNGNNVRSSSFWMSLASLLATVINLATR